MSVSGSILNVDNQTYETCLAGALLAFDQGDIDKGLIQARQASMLSSSDIELSQALQLIGRARALLGQRRRSAVVMRCALVLAEASADVDLAASIHNEMRRRRVQPWN